MTAQHRREIRHLDLSGFDALASSMVLHLNTPCVIGLVGTLGAGKTTLVQSIARAAGIDTADVTSPTFTLMQSHRGDSIVIHHLDAYRIADEDEFIELGVDELFVDDRAWTLVEWADRVSDVMPRDSLWIRIDIEDDSDFRSIALETIDPEVARQIDQVVTGLELQ